MSSRWAAALLCLVGFAVRADAESWTSVFAAENDTVVLLAGDGSLLRAPFSLATRETLWQARGDQHVVRFAVSPVGNRIAWITRGFDGDTTRLWLRTAAGTRQRLRYFSLLPTHHGQRHYEPDVPTVADNGARGARMLQAGALMLRSAANTLQWTSDGRNVVLGYDGGIVSIEADTRAGRGVTDLVAMGLDALHPLPLFLAEALTVESPADRPRVSPFDIAYMFEQKLVVQDGRKVGPSRHSRVLLSLTADGWRMVPAPGWADARVRTIGAGALWWADEGVIHSMQASDSLPREELKTDEDVLWLGYDEAHGDVLGIAGRQLWRMREAGGTPRVVAMTASEIRAVLASATGPSVGVVVRDSLLVWDPRTDGMRRFHSSRLKPCALFESPEGQVMVHVDCGPALPRRLARADAGSGRLLAVETPPARMGAFRAAARGRWILLFDVGMRPPRRLYAYDVRLDRWRTVENPGVSAWEPLR